LKRSQAPGRKEGFAESAERVQSRKLFRSDTYAVGDLYFIEEAIMNLFVANFNEDTTEDDLDELFRPFGKVTNVKILIDFETGKSRGVGFVEFKDDWSARDAIDAMDGKRWSGRHLKVSEARTQSW